MKEMKVGDQVFFYHSNCKQPGIAGICEVVKEAYPDHTAWDASHPHNYDPKSNAEQPKWYMVDVRFVRKLQAFVSLEELRHEKHAQELKDMILLRRSRLSVQPVSDSEWDYILQLEDNLATLDRSR
mmetsp:Transcript_23408/g.44598  ORF Transcript_23408/g.44598 Transcript_23408/m.44598 type:complete len:126 (-) Transcript_23408:53-430(-)